MIKKCEVCGEEFSVRLSVIKKGFGRFCSHKCMGVNQSKFRVKGRNPNWKGENKKCGICGRTFHIKPYRLKTKGGGFCSKTCYGKWRSQTLVGSASGTWKGGGVLSCVICGEEFRVKPSQINKARCCSVKCQNVWQHEFLRGAKSGGWKGGISTVQSVLRNHEKYKEWRNSVFERDNYTCQKCPQIGGILHAHHLRRFSVILNDIRQKFPLLLETDVASNYKDLWDIRNGVTLCKKCHKITHKKEGNK